MGEQADVLQILQPTQNGHQEFQDFARPDGWQEQAVAALVELAPFAYRQMLSELFVSAEVGVVGKRGGTASETPDQRRLGL
jgi:hypothetical protein